MSQSENVDSSVDLLSQKLSNLGLKNGAMEALTDQIKILQDQIAAINVQLTALDQSIKVEEYKEVKVTVTDVKDVSLDMFKTLPEFNGDRNKYSAWRNSAMNVMKIFVGLTQEPKYFEALNIVRNKNHRCCIRRVD